MLYNSRIWQYVGAVWVDQMKYMYFNRLECIMPQTDVSR